jgi:hypothetical protein
MTTTRSLVAAVGLSLLLAACAGAPGATPSTAPPQAVPSGAEPTPVPVPSGGAGGGGSQPGQGGGAVPVDPAPGGGDGGQPTAVEPVAGAVGIHDVAATGLRASVDGQRITAEVRWWSGVEPCNVLAGVDVVRDGTSFVLTIREGTAAGPDTVCIDIAMLKSTTVDLGELEPGS